MTAHLGKVFGAKIVNQMFNNLKN
ncbi:hypothetical protein JL09_g6652 [Pichia kudriavzevii]|uniref:Uncharacterized protein n=1 Tax=Pichia kudriavzevii TaxID=4909 RepID=A0A099NLB9_PICKU|nr:hypothetical protein JL09_g6652 [Pichia kudriavzevii]